MDNPHNRNAVLQYMFLSYLDRVRQGDGDSQWQTLRHSHHQHSNTNDEELDKVLDVDGSALRQPSEPLYYKVVNGKVQDQDDDCYGRHEQTWKKYRKIKDHQL